MASQYTNSSGYGLGAQVVAYAARFLGVRYVWGGTTPAGFDCSGLVQFVYKNFGVTLPRTSQEQASAGVAVSPSALQPGDLLVYSEPGEGPNSHIGIYAGNGQQIDAPYTGASVRYDPVDWSHLSTIRDVSGTTTVPAGTANATATSASLTDPTTWFSGLSSELAGIAISVPIIIGAVALIVIGLWQAFSLPKPSAVPIPV